ncbi:MAG: NADH-quinone oxidoreductase subunit A [Thermoguttaceae bacterium]
MLLPPIVAYLALFAIVGLLFIFVSLLLGRFLRAHSPTPQKVAAYECGEPAVGPGSVQFDLRFYVVALLFLIFEVEVAFFFPPATVFGKARQLRSPQAPPTAAVVKKYLELGVALSPDDADAAAKATAEAPTLALASMLDLGVFFAVLLVGFAFVWRRGDLNWVRAVRHPATRQETAELVAKLRRGDV